MSALRLARDWLLAAPLFALGFALSRLPSDRAMRIAASFARGWLAVGGPRVAVARRNLEIAFPDASRAERERLLRAHFEHLGHTLAEIALLHGPQHGELLGAFRLEGLEHYEATLRTELEAGRSGGMLILSAHLGSWELGGLAMADRGYPLSAVHHEIANEPLRNAIQAWRTSTGMETLELGRAGLALFRALSRGRLIALLCDQNAGRDEGHFVPFFGELASTRDGPVRIAMARGVPMLPVFFYRESADPLRHVARAFPALEIEAEGDDPEGALLRNLSRMNEAIEAGIRLAPEQWLWVHRRWNRRPPGEPRLYPRR